MITAIRRLGVKAVYENIQKRHIVFGIKKTPSESDEIRNNPMIRQTSDLWISQYFGRRLKERFVFSEREFQDSGEIKLKSEATVVMP